MPSGSRLTDAIRPLADPTAVKNEAARVLGTHLRASRVVYAEVLPDGQLVIERSYTDGVSDMPGRHYVDDHARCCSASSEPAATSSSRMC